jgi:hypothetical protein
MHINSTPELTEDEEEALILAYEEAGIPVTDDDWTIFFNAGGCVTDAGEIVDGNGTTLVIPS